LPISKQYTTFTKKYYTMVLHTNPTLRNHFIEMILNKFPKVGKKNLNALATDRLEYLSNLVAESNPNSKSEINRVLSIKSKFNRVNDDRKYTFTDKHSIKTQFV